MITTISDKLTKFESRLQTIEEQLKASGKAPATHAIEIEQKGAAVKSEGDDEDVDLFGSDSEEENEEAERIRKERLEAYHAKKSTSKLQWGIECKIVID